MDELHRTHFHKIKNSVLKNLSTYVWIIEQTMILRQLIIWITILMVYILSVTPHHYQVHSPIGFVLTKV